MNRASVLMPVLLAPVLLALAAPTAARAQGRGIVLQAQPPAQALPPAPPPQPALRAPGDYQPAPTPNRDYEAPSGPRPSNAPQLAPGLFTRKDVYRGEGFSRGSTSESDTEKRVKPAPGFSLRMPLQPQ